MPAKHDYSTPVPQNMKPQRGGTPRNAGSPPPDLPPDRFSQPPRTQAYPYGSTANSPPQQPVRKGDTQSTSPQSQGAVGGRAAGSEYQPQPTRPGSHDTTMKNQKQGMGPDMKPGGGGGRKPPSGPEKPTGTVEPERRGMKEAGRATVDSADYSITNPRPTQPDGRGVGWQPSPHDDTRNRRS